MALFVHPPKKGCEQVKQSGAQGKRFAEAVGINSSLLVLGKGDFWHPNHKLFVASLGTLAVINALVEDKPHVPYLESKLTMLLRSALGGNSRTTAVVNCSGDNEQAHQTLHALRYGKCFVFVFQFCRCIKLFGLVRFGERCAMVTNRADFSSMSLAEALKTVDTALSMCQKQVSLPQVSHLSPADTHCARPCVCVLTDASARGQGLYGHTRLHPAPAAVSAAKTKTN